MTENNDDNKDRKSGSQDMIAVGWLAIVFSSIALMASYSEKSKVALLIGIIMCVIGIVLVLLGKRRSR